jgi:hypothetical protein
MTAFEMQIRIRCAVISRGPPKSPGPVAQIRIGPDMWKPRAVVRRSAIGVDASPPGSGVTPSLYCYLPGPARNNDPRTGHDLTVIHRDCGLPLS